MGRDDVMTDTWLERAVALSEMEDWHGLLDWCVDWTKSEPENANAWGNLGDVYSKRKRYAAAIDRGLSGGYRHHPAWHWLQSIMRRQPSLFAHWKPSQVKAGQ